MQTVTATNARKEFFELIKGATQRHQIFRIHHKTGDAILIPEDDYDNMVETLHLLTVQGLKESLLRSTKQVAAKETASMEEAFKGKD